MDATNAGRTAKRILDFEQDKKCPACGLPGGGNCPECKGAVHDQANAIPKPHIGDDYSVTRGEPGM